MDKNLLRRLVLATEGNPGTGYDQPRPSNTPLKGQVFLSSQDPGLISLDVVAHQSTH